MRPADRAGPAVPLRKGSRAPVQGQGAGGGPLSPTRPSQPACRSSIARSSEAAADRRKGTGCGTFRVEVPSPRAGRGARSPRVDSERSSWTRGQHGTVTRLREGPGAGGRRVPGMRLGALTTSRPVRGRGQGRTPRGTLGPPPRPPPSSPSPAAQGAREARGGRDRLRSRVSGARTRAGRRAPPTRPRPRRSAAQTRSQREPTCAKTLTASHCNNDRKRDRSVVRHFH